MMDRIEEDKECSLRIETQDNGRVLHDVTPEDLEENGEFIRWQNATSIGDNAFDECRGRLRKIVIPQGIIFIGIGAFYGHKNLREVTLSTTVICIKDQAFEGCTGLSRVELLAGLVYIGPFAFARCSSLIDVIIPATLRSTWGWPFNDCTSLCRIIIPNSSLDCKASMGHFEGLFNGLHSLLVPAAFAEIQDSVLIDYFRNKISDLLSKDIPQKVLNDTSSQVVAFWVLNLA